MVIKTFTSEKGAPAVDTLLTAVKAAAERIKKQEPTEFEECLVSEFNELRGKFR